MVKWESHLPGTCPRCGGSDLKAQEGPLGKFSITCFDWCGLASIRKKSLKEAERWLKEARKYIQKAR
jgi:hypothetical protein